MRKTGISIGLILLAASLSGQPRTTERFGKPPEHSVSLELLGAGMAYAFNFEQLLWSQSPYYQLYGRVGINYLNNSTPGQEASVSVIPVSLNSVFFSGKHHFEIDLGGMPYFFWKNNHPDGRKAGFFPMFSPAYRFQAHKSRGFLLKVSLVPWYFPQEIADNQFVYWPGLTLGYGF